MTPPIFMSIATVRQRAIRNAGGRSRALSTACDIGLGAAPAIAAKRVRGRALGGVSA